MFVVDFPFNPFQPSFLYMYPSFLFYSEDADKDHQTIKETLDEIENGLEIGHVPDNVFEDFESSYKDGLTEFNRKQREKHGFDGAFCKLYSKPRLREKYFKNLVQIMFNTMERDKGMFFVSKKVLFLLVNHFVKPKVRSLMSQGEFYRAFLLMRAFYFKSGVLSPLMEGYEYLLGGKHKFKKGQKVAFRKNLTGIRSGANLFSIITLVSNSEKKIIEYGVSEKNSAIILEESPVIPDEYCEGCKVYKVLVDVIPHPVYIREKALKFDRR